jgi:putative addiction module component (TIGR02574 family)
MTQNPKIAELLDLPPSERLEIVEALWDSLASDPASVPVPDWHLELLDDRLADDDAETNPGDNWETVRKRIEGAR